MGKLWRKTKAFFSKKYVKPISIGLLTILIVPLIVSFLMESPLMDLGSQKAESWMSFWGGYLGAILGIAGAITATTIQIKSQTSQIVLAATKNDEFERQRIYTNMLIEKNVILYKELIEMKRLFINYRSFLNELVEKQRDHIVSTSFFYSEIERVMEISKLKRQNDSANDLTVEQREYLKMHENITNDQKFAIESIKRTILLDLSTISSLTSSISSNSIFLQNHPYTDHVKQIINAVENEVESYNLKLSTNSFAKDLNSINKFKADNDHFFSLNYQTKIDLIESNYPGYSELLINKLFND